jgi:nucleotide-binding universal stress UspA family protein
MFGKILVPYDGSKPADSAVRYAIGLAKAAIQNSQIILVNIVPHIPATPLLLERPVKTKGGETIALSEYIERLYDQMQKHAAEMLEKKEKEIVAQAGDSIAIRTIVMIGDQISDKILESAKRENVDLIIVGNVGLGGLSKLKTLGSVSRSISERAPCPVMIVH